MDIKRNEKTGFAISWNPANSRGTILQGHSHMDGMSWFVDRECPEEQTSRVRIIAVSSDDTAAVSACNGVTREMMRAKRIKILVFLIE